VPALAWFVDLSDASLTAAVASLRQRLAAAGFVDCGDVSEAVGPAGQFDGVMVWADRPMPDGLQQRLIAGPGVCVLAGPTLQQADPHGQLAEAAGVTFDLPTGVHDVRVRAGRDGAQLRGRLLDHGHAGLAHLGEHAHVTDRVLAVAKTGDDVAALLTANLGLRAHPVAAWRPRGSEHRQRGPAECAGGVLAWTLGTRPEAVASSTAVRVLTLVLRSVFGLPEPAPVRVGLLGYGAIGHEHSRAVRHTTGLELAAVCDTSAERRAAAAEHAPGVRLHDDAGALLADDIDLVVISTPPNTHAAWAIDALSAGKHVIVEKPFAIRTGEADAILALARERRLLAAVYQNRRFDPDHLAIRRAIDAGLIGEVFHVEAFVGGYGHPCNLWHSDADASGGAFYDWGAHTLDQILDLMPQEVEHVTAAEHKRRWLDVTNADHSRVTIRFVDGAEATFVYSDLAAALKPRWYVLGTQGALVGHWRTERVISRSDIGTLAEDVLAPADSPPLLDLHTCDGSVTRLATPPASPYRFHAELADRIQLGLEMSVTGAQSRRVLAVMEAATRSARDGGRPVVPQ
jgi:predicted dehydrogenase